MSTENTALVKSEPTPDFNAFGSIQHFEGAQRMAKALCSSSIVPQAYQGDQNLGNCVIALEIANRIGANILSVMQNLYVVHGKPAWSSQFLISCVNASRKFTPLRYKMTGTKGQQDYGCIAWAVDKTGERLESPEVTMAMANAEGWVQKNGSKWKTMPELMLRYRAATLFTRLYAPELTMGIHTDDEAIDIGMVETSPVVTDNVKRPQFDSPPLEPEVLPAKARAPRKAKETPPVAPEVLPPEQVAADEAAEKAPAEPTFEQVVDGDDEPEAVKALRRAMEAAGVTEKQVIAFCEKSNLFNPNMPHTLRNILAPKMASLTKQLLIPSNPLIDAVKSAGT